MFIFYFQFMKTFKRDLIALGCMSTSFKNPKCIAGCAIRHLNVYLFFYLSFVIIYLFICHSFIHLFVHLFIYLFVSSFCRPAHLLPMLGALQSSMPSFMVRWRGLFVFFKSFNYICLFIIILFIYYLFIFIIYFLYLFIYLFICWFIGLLLTLFEFSEKLLLLQLSVQLAAAPLMEVSAVYLLLSIYYYFLFTVICYYLFFISFIF